MSLTSAWKAYHSGDLDEAGKTFEAMSSKEGAPAQAHIQQGLFLLHTGHYEKAQGCFAKAKGLETANPAPLFFLALSQELAKSYPESHATIADLKSLAPHHQGILSLELLEQIQKGDPLELLSRFGYGPNKNAKGGGKPLERLAAGLGKGDPEALPAELSSSDFLLGPILLEIEKKMHPMEVPHIERHPDPLPEDLTTIKPRKRSLAQEVAGLRGSFRSSIPLRKGKNLFEKAYGIEDRQRQTRLLKKAALLLRAARKLDPYGFRVSYHLGETYLFLARGEPGYPYNRFRLLQAQTSFLQSIDHEGVNPYVLFYLAYVQHLLGRPLVAVRLYREATKKFEKLPEAHYGEGQCQLLLGNDTEAKRLLLKAVNSDLALARERLELYATLLSKHGSEFFRNPIPELPPEEALPEVVEENAAEELPNCAEPEAAPSEPTEESVKPE